MKAPSSRMFVLAGFWIAAAMSAAEPPLHAANDNAPAPHHGGDHDPAPQAVRPAKKRTPPATAGNR